MEYLIDIFGNGGSLNTYQMSFRALIIFFYTLLLMRIAGRRSFGLNAPFDNIIIILLGAVLSRAVVGASPFFPTISASLIISILHRVVGLYCIDRPWFENIIKGEKIMLFQHDKLIPKNLKRSLVSVEDISQEIRYSLNKNSFEGIDSIYMERNGKISITEKK